MVVSVEIDVFKATTEERTALLRAILSQGAYGILLLLLHNNVVSERSL